MFKDEKPEALQDALVCWVWQVYTQSGTETYKVVKEQAEVHGQDMSVTNFANKNCHIFPQQNEIIVKISRLTV
jgi:hypothetical protein